MFWIDDVDCDVDCNVGVNAVGVVFDIVLDVKMNVICCFVLFSPGMEFPSFQFISHFPSLKLAQNRAQNRGQITFAKGLITLFRPCYTNRITLNN